MLGNQIRDTCDALLRCVLEDCMLMDSLIDGLHSVLEVVVEPGALECSHLRVAIYEAINEYLLRQLITRMLAPESGN